MDFAKIVAISCCALFLLSAVNGQITRKNPRGCPPANSQGGNYIFAHPTFMDMFCQCDSAGVRTNKICPPGTVFNSRLSTCVWPFQLTDSPEFPCTPNTMPKYPSICSDKYWECNGYSFEARNCTFVNNILGSFQMENGQCISSVPRILDEPECYRFGTDASRDPRINCTLVADPNNVCNYRVNLANNRQSESVRCADGTIFAQELCTCNHDVSNRCTKTYNATSNKQKDAQCRAGTLVDFRPTLRASPQVVSEKLGTVANPALTDEYVQVNQVEVSSGQATFSYSPQTGSNPYLF